MSQPAAIVWIGLMSAPVLHVRSVSRNHTDVRLKQVEDRLPVSAGTLNHGVSATFGDQPFGEPLKPAHNHAELLTRVGLVSCATGHDADHDELLANIDAGASFKDSFDHRRLQCGQAAGGGLGILFYGLRRGTSQVYVSRRRARLSFGSNHQLVRDLFLRP